MRASGHLLQVILLGYIHSAVEIAEKIPGRRIRRSSGGSSGIAYIQVIPLNKEASDLHVVMSVLTEEVFPYKESTTEITSIVATTECTKKDQKMECGCLSEFHFDMQQCISHPSCYIPDKDDEYCFCPELYANNTVYCEEPPPPPGKITLSPIPATLGSDIVLEFTASDDVTNIRWFLGNVRLKMVMEVHNGSRTTVVTSGRTSTLTIKNIPRYWGVLVSSSSTGTLVVLEWF
ncbi:adhesion G-protein coupled receptor F3-like [Engystomops pustulosus]|uniref:adhesion G-protein coupled receptor F3-like n=1 Tax=Engystomops pustulosus TaxID=76066 RepID=UPI003AFA6E65